MICKRGVTGVRKTLQSALSAIVKILVLSSLMSRLMRVTGSKATLVALVGGLYGWRFVCFVDVAAASLALLTLDNKKARISGLFYCTVINDGSGACL